MPRVTTRSPNAFRVQLFGNARVVVIPERLMSQTHQALAALHPMGRMGEVSDIVDAVLYLDGAQFVTGEILHVDGGQAAGHHIVGGLARGLLGLGQSQRRFGSSGQENVHLCISRLAQMVKSPFPLRPIPRS
jgi:hypothetical protein